jgi:hypothetical protein
MTASTLDSLLCALERPGEATHAKHMPLQAIWTAPEAD